eukprot:GHVR01191332.1.p1 GENE.GHVR01191332.1~~GHVR01191332.1.p1  ORF type:complete len:295 (+),score=79.58 GHVR01191332.1:132-1016(+)
MGQLSSRGRADIDPKALKLKPEVLESDPDFGWKELRDEVRSRGADPHLPEYGNELTGKTCQTHSVVMAINLATRARALAERFNVYSNKQQQYAVEKASYKSNGNSDYEYGQIYALLKVPDMGWRLIDEKFEEGKPTLVSCRKAPPVKDDNDTCPFASNVSRVCKDGRTFVCNVGCLGLNTHEMLKRLEKSTDTPAELPVDAFSWEFTGSRRGHAVEVVPPDEKSLLTPLKSALWCVPYELMLSVSDWVKLTYRTQPPDAFFDSNEERERKSAIQKLNENRKKDKQKKPLVFGHH